MGFFSFLPLLLVLVAIYAGYRLVQTDEENDESEVDSKTDPVEHLQEQYVEGEITEAKFERRLDQHYESTARTSVEMAKRRESESEREE